MINKIKRIKTIIRENENRQEEILYASIYNSSIKNCGWWTEKINPGRWAVGYSFLYVLFRILDEIEPQKILEFGLGQSTVMTTSYVNNKERCLLHEIIEHDQEWIDFFEKKINLTLSHINKVTLQKAQFKSKDIFCYKDISSCMNDKYQLILIDAPFESDGFSRIDILNYIPDCLDSSFIIMMHDYNREGEKNCVELIKQKLAQNNINYHCGVYKGTQHTCVITSEDLKFVCTM